MPPAGQRRRALSAWSATGAAAGAAGYLLGGGLTELVGWRAMFWLNLPLAAVMAAGVLRHVDRDRGRAAAGLDLPGAGLFASAVMCLVLGGSRLQRSGAAVSGLPILAIAIVLLAALILIERRIRDPLFSAELLRQTQLRVGAAAAFANTATTSSAVAIATIELQRDHRIGPAAAGLRMLPFSLCVIAGAAIAGRALRRLSERGVIAIGLGAIAVGDALAAVNVSLLIAAVGTAGAGIGLSSVAATGLATSVDERLQGTAAGVVNTAAQVGTALGVAALLLLVVTTTDARLPLSGPRLGWAAAAAIAFASAALILPKLRPVSTGPQAGTARRSSAASASTPAPAPGRTRDRPR